MRLVLAIIVGFFRFWYDFIIGDCWQIAAGVAVVLVAGALLIAHGVLSPTTLPFTIAGALMALVVFSVVIEFRKKMAG
jgi:hypothetical protein